MFGCGAIDMSLRFPDGASEAACQSRNRKSNQPPNSSWNQDAGSAPSRVQTQRPTARPHRGRISPWLRPIERKLKRSVVKPRFWNM